MSEEVHQAYHAGVRWRVDVDETLNLKWRPLHMNSYDWCIQHEGVGPKMERWERVVQPRRSQAVDRAACRPGGGEGGDGKEA